MADVYVAVPDPTHNSVVFWTYFRKISSLETLDEVVVYLRKYFGDGCLPTEDLEAKLITAHNCTTYWELEKILQGTMKMPDGLPRRLLVAWFDTHQAKRAEDGNVSHTG